MDRKNSVLSIISIDGENSKQTSNYLKNTNAYRSDNSHLAQNVFLIWLDSNINAGNDEDCRHTTAQLRQVVSSVNTFTDADACINFLTDVSNEQAFMIISVALSQAIVPLIHNITQLDSIFIFGESNTEHELWTAEWPKVKGIFAEAWLLCEAIKQLAHQCEQNTMSISFVSTSDIVRNQNLDQLNQSFMYTQILKEILLTIEFKEQHIKEFIDYCKEHFANSDPGLNRVKNFEEKYRLNKPVWLYTHETFLYSMLNHALRVMDVNAIMKMGFFVCDLHRHIEELCNDQFGTQHSTKSFVVYRGQGLSKTDFDQMVKTKGGLISFNNFLSTSENREVSLLFAETNTSDPNLIGILFVMTIAPSKSTTFFARIKGIGHFEQENEILFSMHTIFRIHEIKQISKNKRLWQVNLTLTTDDDKDLHALAKHIRNETIPRAEGWDRLGLFLLKIGQPEKAEHIYDDLLKHTNNNRKIADFQHQLGCAKHAQKKYSEAIICYEKSLEVMQKTLRPNHLNLVAPYENIGTAYQNMGEYLKAVAFYKKALEIQQKTLPSDHPYWASSYNNIGSLHLNMKEHSNALEFFEKVLVIEEKTLPPNHPDLASSYNNIGSLHLNMKRYLKALEFFEKALAIQEKTLPPDHPHLAFCYHNIGATYRDLGEHSKSKSFHQKAREINRKISSSNKS